MEFNTWYKPAASGNNGGQCVAVRRTPDGYEVGDTKNPQGPTLTFSNEEWAAFLETAATGQWIPTPMQ